VRNSVAEPEPELVPLAERNFNFKFFLKLWIPLAERNFNLKFFLKLWKKPDQPYEGKQEV
jgi:hypothetical protein